MKYIYTKEYLYSIIVFFLSLYFSVITTRKSVNFEQLSKLPWRGRPVGGEWNNSSLKFSGFRERVVRGISVPNFVEIRDLSELSCMSLNWDISYFMKTELLLSASTAQPISNVLTKFRIQMVHLAFSSDYSMNILTWTFIQFSFWTMRESFLNVCPNISGMFHECYHAHWAHAAHLSGL